MLDSSIWDHGRSMVATEVRAQSQRAVESFKAQPELLVEQFNLERSVVESGYRRAQLNELVQNAADSMQGLEARLQIVLTESTLYCANEGMPFQPAGVTTIMMAHHSAKRGKEIGRYGLGFKSVLEISDRPEIISQSASFRWSKDITRAALDDADVTHDLENLPILRVAEVFDPASEAKVDSILAEMMEWATTVVRLPLNEGAHQQVSQAISMFRGEFVLFSDSIGRLELEDRTTGRSRTWSATRVDHTTVDLRSVDVTAGNATDETEHWRVFTDEHRPSPEAAAAAGARNSREELLVHWAVPAARSGRRALGEVWSFFPTESTTSLAGIVNAPFQTADDRHDIIRGPYNEEILTKRLTKIVAGALPLLADPEKPSRHLTLLPSRDREVRSWADSIINEPMFKWVAQTSCLPDLTGQLRFPSELLVPPILESKQDEELRDARDLWYTLADIERQELAKWLHKSALHNDGAGTHVKVRTILENASVQAQEPVALFEALASTGSLQGFRSALEFAATVDRSFAPWSQDMRRAAFIPTADGRLTPPSSRVTLPDPSDPSPEGAVVIPAVAKDPSCLARLKELGITGHDDEGRLRRAVREARRLGTAESFESLWDTLHQVADGSTAMQIMLESFHDPSRVLVRRLDGSWRPVDETWQFGSVFHSSLRDSDASLLLDSHYHRLDFTLLSRWGLRQSLPDQTSLRADEEYAKAWKDAVLRPALREAHDVGLRVSRGDIELSETVLSPGLLALRDASPVARKRIVDILADRLGSDIGLRVRASYRTWSTRVLSPDAWWVQQFGHARTPIGLLPIDFCTSGDDLETSFPRDLLPIPENIGHFAQVVLPDKPTDAAWAHILGAAIDEINDLKRVHALYAHSASAGARKPDRLRALDIHNSRFTDAEYCVVTFRDAVTAHVVQHRELGVIQVENPALARALASAWSMDVIDINFSSTVPEDSYDEPVALNSRFPHIGEVDVKLKRLKFALADDVVLRTTNDQDDVVTEDRSKRVRFIREQSLLILDRELEGRILQFALKIVDSKFTPDQARRVMKEKEREARIKEAAEKQNEWEKLLAYFGADSFEAVVPSSVRALIEEYLGEELDAEKLFGVAKAMYGNDVVRQLSRSLRDTDGSQGPTRFSGSSQAKSFMRKLGIDPAYAGEKYVRLPAQELVVGPVRLNPLHEFQEDVSTQVRRILAGDEERRAMVQLPTGAGKTRVAVESVVRHVASAETPQKGHVLWIAQTKELCEQAVSTWMTVWRAFGAENANMVVSRFWDSNPRDAVTVEAGLHVVVSTPQTATRMFSSEAPKDAWFRKPGLVIVDEAHGAEAETTKEMLSRFPRRGNARIPVIGLSATPYRGTDERRTQNLVDLFDNNLLRPAQFDLEDATTYLQNNGYLAQVDHHTLQGIALSRTAKPRESAEDEVTVSLIDRMAEAALDLDAVARSADRNNEIIRSVLARGKDQRTLLFAASVEHAHALAAVFSYEGVAAAAVDADTSPGARRGAVEQFRRGDLKVLTNFNVLSQGFDVPDVNAVYVCRPTFVPNRYLQMIGRGLRGPQNGGTERVDIVNVKDNAEIFNTSLAFTHFDHLWTRTT